MMGTVQRFGGHVTAALLGQVTIVAAIDARAPIWQLNSWILPSRMYQKSAVGDVELGPRRPDHAGGRLERTEEVAPDRQFDRDNG
jgi:hypothetical protein